jgi:hypothetical protein
MVVTSKTTVVAAGVVTTTDVSSRKRPTSIKILGPHVSVRPKKVQRTIDRLQPGKSKGNLLFKKPPENVTNGDTSICQSAYDNDQINRDLNDEPKLSLGSVLKNVDSIQLICKNLVSSPNHLSNEDDDEESINKPVTLLLNITEEPLQAMKKNSVNFLKDAEIEKPVDNEKIQKPKSATPNLSAW